MRKGWGTGRVENGVEVGCRERNLDDAEVVVNGAGDVLVGGDEGLGDEECKFGVGRGERDGFGGETRRE